MISVPSEFAQRIQHGMRRHANVEVQRHLRAGRSVTGLLDGELVVINPRLMVITSGSEWIMNGTEEWINPRPQGCARDGVDGVIFVKDM